MCYNKEAFPAFNWFHAKGRRERPFGGFIQL